MEYITITRNHKLDDEINELIKDGYKPIGGITMVSIEGKLWMSQALTKATKRKVKKFIKPTELEIKRYAKENNLNLLGFYTYFESNGWKVGRNGMKDWQAAARGWSKRQGGDIPQPKTPEQQKAAESAVWERLGYDSEEAYSKGEFKKQMEQYT